MAEWKELYLALGQKLDKDDIYWTVFNPSEKEDPMAGTLSDDVADIYYDLKSGLLALEEGSNVSLKDIEWEWRFNFESHWGKHAVEALMAIHHLANPGTA